jgi:hypothetical protein
VGGFHILMVYANDVNLLTYSICTIKENTEVVIDAANDIGIDVNMKKTKNM